MAIAKLARDIVINLDGHHNEKGRDGQWSGAAGRGLHLGPGKCEGSESSTRRCCSGVFRPVLDRAHGYRDVVLEFFRTIFLGL